MPSKLCLTILYRLLAEGYAHLRRPAEALAAIETAFSLVQLTRESFFEPELHRFRGELLLQRLGSGAEARAEECFWKAVHLARQQSAKSWELRASTSLSRLWAQQDKHTGAFELMVPLCAWFTEGDDTADLKDARALLEELR
jgi:predicted ATPase